MIVIGDLLPTLNELDANSTFNVRCSNDKQCQQIDHGNFGEYVCVDNLCRCGPDYRASTFNASNGTDGVRYCEKFLCKTDEECKDYDQHRVCRPAMIFTNSCQCDDHYLADKDHGMKCIATTSAPHRDDRCQTVEECEQINPNMTCVADKCRCKPNHKRMTTEVGECQPFICTDDEDCNEWDTNRVCRGKGTDRKCECRTNFRDRDPQTGTEFVLCQRYSTLNEECVSGSDCNDTQRCINKLCKCLPDYALQNDPGVCYLRQCSSHADCSNRDEDPNRACSCWGIGCKGYCRCLSGYNQNADNGNRCEMFVNPQDIGWNTWWIYVVILVGWTLILLCVVFACYKLRKFKKRRYFTNPSHFAQPNRADTPMDTLRGTPSYVRAESVRAESVPFTVSGTSSNSNYNYDIFRLLQLMRPSYYEPPPSYDSIPGSRPAPSEAVQCLNINNLNDSYPEHIDSNHAQIEEPIYENLPCHSNGRLNNNLPNDQGQSNQVTNKLEQLSMQL